MKRAANSNRFNLILSTVLMAAFILSAPAFCLAKEKVIIFHAGSLSVPFAKMEKIFESRHPDIDIMRQAGGSTKMARMISQHNKPADIMASADFKVIDKNLIPANADWNIRFTSNQLVLCYTDKSKFAAEVNADNWHEILRRKGVVWGHSEPNLDPCGYRSLMVLQLAEKFYKKPGLYGQLIANRPQENVRPKAVELVGMLKAGKMDYGWEYLSVAVQHGLKYVTLDDHINLGNNQYDSFYKQAQVKVTGKKSGTFITRTGKSCTYGITMIKTAPNPDGAVLFLQYLLSPEGGLKILESMGQPSFVPSRVTSKDVKNRLPQNISALVEVKP
jgi:molybdate/tungstate transport system substrate-binding protein